MTAIHCRTGLMRVSPDVPKHTKEASNAIGRTRLIILGDTACEKYDQVDTTVGRGGTNDGCYQLVMLLLE